MRRLDKIIRVAVVISLCLVMLLPHASVGDTLDMDDAVCLGMERHPDVKVAGGELDIARGDLLRTISPESPVVFVENGQVPRRSGILSFGEQKLGVGQSLEFPLVTFLRAQAGKQAVRSAESNGKLVRAMSEAEIRMAFVRAWLADRQVAITDSLAGAAELLAVKGEKKERAGDITALDGARLTVQAEEFARENDLARLRQQVAIARLEQMTGKRLAPGTVLVSPELADWTDVEREELKGGSAFVQRATFAAGAAGRSLTAEKLAWLPRVEVKLFRQLTTDEQFWGGELAFSLPVWYLLGERGAILKARGQYQMASAARENALREWESRWIEASQSYVATLKTVEGFEKIALPVSRRALQAAIRSYEVGELGITDLLSSFIQEGSVELGYLDAIEAAWHWRTQLDVLTVQY